MKAWIHGAGAPVEVELSYPPPQGATILVGEGLDEKKVRHQVGATFWELIRPPNAPAEIRCVIVVHPAPKRAGI